MVKKIPVNISPIGVASYPYLNKSDTCFDDDGIYHVKMLYTKKEVKLIKSQFPFYSSNDIKFRIIRDDILNNQQFELLMDTLIEEKGTSPSELANDLWLTNSHLKKLSADGHYIGMHAYNHPYAMSELSYDVQLEQLKNNYDHITDVTGKNPVSMSYPNNSYNKNTIKILNELNIISGFRSNMVLVKSTNINKSLIIPRMDHSNIIFKT